MQAVLRVDTNTNIKDSLLLLPGGRRIFRSQVRVDTARSSGPGGQHVNKTETKVVLRFDLQNCPEFKDEERARLLARLAPKLTQEGELLVSSDKTRSQRRNLEDAFDRLQSLLMSALIRPKTRRATRPTRGSVRRRLKAKRIRSEIKKTRSSTPDY